jgi:hypothetical protein
MPFAEENIFVAPSACAASISVDENFFSAASRVFPVDFNVEVVNLSTRKQVIRLNDVTVLDRPGLASSFQRPFLFLFFE